MCTHFTINRRQIRSTIILLTGGVIIISRAVILTAVIVIVVGVRGGRYSLVTVIVCVGGLLRYSLYVVAV